MDYVKSYVKGPCEAKCQGRVLTPGSRCHRQRDTMAPPLAGLGLNQYHVPDKKPSVATGGDLTRKWDKDKGTEKKAGQYGTVGETEVVGRWVRMIQGGGFGSR